MKRGWIGLFLLLILLAGGLLVTWHMGSSHEAIAAKLDLAARQALAGNWEMAEDLAEDAQDRWEDSWHFSASFADHEPMETIDSLFAQLEACQAVRDQLSFAVICAQLAEQVQALGDAHGLTWWNLL